MNTFFRYYLATLVVYNSIRLIKYMRKKVRAKSENSKNILKNGEYDNTNITFFPNQPYISSCDPNAQIRRKPHFASTWFTKSDLTIRFKINS